MAQLVRVEIPAPHGLLEGLLRRPDGQMDAAGASGAAPPRAPAALVCHPHPQGGGTMDNKVVFHLAQALGEAGMPTLRFNFRGVGRSTGCFDDGRGEADDVRTAVDYLARLYPDLPLCLAGFSFGAWVGLPVGCADTRVRQVIGAGIPVNLLDVDALASCGKPKLIIQGARDQYGAHEALHVWYDALPAPKELVVIPDADHFFTGQLDVVRAAIVHYLATRTTDAEG